MQNLSQVFVKNRLYFLILAYYIVYDKEDSIDTKIAKVNEIVEVLIKSVLIEKNVFILDITWEMIYIAASEKGINITPKNSMKKKFNKFIEKNGKK